jgi:hypothetical protein
MRTAGIGVALGLAGSVALTRCPEPLFGVGAHLPVYRRDDLLLGVALTACYPPARRDARRSHRGSARLVRRHFQGRRADAALLLYRSLSEQALQVCPLSAAPYD